MSPLATRTPTIRSLPSGGSPPPRLRGRRRYALTTRMERRQGRQRVQDRAAAGARRCARREVLRPRRLGARPDHPRGRRGRAADHPPVPRARLHRRVGQGVMAERLARGSGHPRRLRRVDGRTGEQARSERSRPGWRAARPRVSRSAAGRPERVTASRARPRATRPPGRRAELAALPVQAEVAPGWRHCLLPVSLGHQLAHPHHDRLTRSSGRSVSSSAWSRAPASSAT